MKSDFVLQPKIPTAKPEDFRKATQHIHRGRGSASSITVQILPATGK